VNTKEGNLETSVEAASRWTEVQQAPGTFKGKDRIERIGWKGHFYDRVDENITSVQEAN
jgi:hypothetical protein